MANPREALDKLTDAVAACAEATKNAVQTSGSYSPESIAALAEATNHLAEAYARMNK
jgi:hypothetical protein